MKKKWPIYLGFFAILLIVFYFFLFKLMGPYQSSLAVINDKVPLFSFTNQNGKLISDRDVEGKVYVAEYFFTTCKAICPKMNANMRRVYDIYKNENNFAILSHTCMPETDSVPVLKEYEQKMLKGTVEKAVDGSYRIDEPAVLTGDPAAATNWFFLTGDKAVLYRMARGGYLIDDNRRDTSAKISDQFLHTQFFSLVDKQGRVRGIYDGTKTVEVDKMIVDIKDLMKEKSNKRNFLNNTGNTPN